MRPLVVLLLLIAAALALVFTLWRSSPTPVRQIDAPGISAPENPKPATPASPDAVQTPVDDTRVATPVGPKEGSGTNDSAVEVAGKNTLYGLVTNEQKQPLRGAKVQLSPDPLMGQEVAMRWISDRPTTGTPIVTTTDEKGVYRFSRVIPRRDYYLVVSHENYAPVQEQLVAVGEEGDFQGPNVVMKTGSTVFGTVTDSGGNTVPNAELWLDSAFFSGDGESPDRLITKSDATGHFEFANVYPVTKQLTCTAEGYGSQTKSPVYVTGAPGERVSVEFVLEVGQPIAGKVLGANGVAIKDAKIVGYCASNNASFRGEAQSKEDGSFEMPNLHPGTYILNCEAKGYRQAKAARVAVGNVSVIIDMVEQACINGRAVDPAGNPVTSFTASVRRLAPNQLPGAGTSSEETGVKETFTNVPDGSFQLCGLDPGTYTVLASSASFAPTFSESFSISAEHQTANITVRLSKGGSIKGRVVSPAGAPVGGVTVTTHDDTYEDDPTNDLFAGLVPSNTTSRRVVTDAAGVFELKFLNPEKYQLRLNHPGFAQGKQRNVSVVDGQATDIGTIQMQVGGSVKGVVIAQGGGPLAGAYVHLESESSDIVLDTRSDAEGRYLFTHVRPSNYTLSATAQSTNASGDAFNGIIQMQRSQTPISVAEGSELTRDLSMTGN